MLRDPDLIILDEPTNGLDPAGTREVRELIPSLARQGRTVFLCSHLLHEVQAVSDRVAIVKKGRMVAQGTVAELLGSGQYLRIRAADNDALATALAACRSSAGSSASMASCAPPPPSIRRRN